MVYAYKVTVELKDVDERFESIGRVEIVGSTPFGRESGFSARPNFLRSRVVLGGQNGQPE